MNRALMVCILAACHGGGGDASAPHEDDKVTLYGDVGAKPIESLAIGGSAIVASDGTRLVRVDLKTGATKATPTGGGDVLAISADGAHVAAIADRALAIDGAPVPLADGADPLGVAFAADGSLAVQASASGDYGDVMRVLVLDAATHAVRATATGGGGLDLDAGRCRIAIGAAGDLAVASCGSRATATRMRDGAELAATPLPGLATVVDIAEPAPGQFAFVGQTGVMFSGHLAVALPDGTTAEDPAKLSEDERVQCALAPSARLVACAATDDKGMHPVVAVHTTAAKLPVVRRVALPADATRLAFTADGATLVVGLEDGRVAAIDVRATLAAAPALATQPSGHPALTDLALATDLAPTKAVTRRLMSIGDDASADDSDEPLYITHVSSLAASPDGKRLALSLSQTDQIQIVDAATAKQAKLIDHAETATLAWSPSGAELATFGKQGDQITIGKVTSTTWSELGAPITGEVATHTVAWTRDGAQVVVPEAGGGIELRAAADGAHARHIPASAGKFVGFALGGADRLVAWTDREFAVWDLATGGKHAMPTVQHRGPIVAAAWAPDGARFATVSDDGTAILWDAATLAPQHVVQASYHANDALAWSPDGAHLAIADPARGITIWRAADGKAVARIAPGETDHLRTNLFAWVPAGLVIGMNRKLAWLAVPPLQSTPARR